MTNAMISAELLAALRILREAIAKPGADVHGDHIQWLIERADRVFNTAKGLT